MRPEFQNAAPIGVAGCMCHNGAARQRREGALAQRQCRWHGPGGLEGPIDQCVPDKAQHGRIPQVRDEALFGQVGSGVGGQAGVIVVKEDRDPEGSNMASHTNVVYVAVSEDEGPDVCGFLAYLAQSRG